MLYLIYQGTGVTPTTDSPTGTFERVAVGDAYTVSNYDPVIANKDITPPSRITDIQVIDIHSGLSSTSTTRNYTITWTAPGDDANVGQGKIDITCATSDINVNLRIYIFPFIHLTHSVET